MLLFFEAPEPMIVKLPSQVCYVWEAAKSGIARQLNSRRNICILDTCEDTMSDEALSHVFSV